MCSEKRKNKGKIVKIVLLVGVLFTMFYVVSLIDMDRIEHQGIITMKWDSPKLTTTHYYFEIENNTVINIESYDYHKYDKGDTYTWITTEYSFS